MSDFDVAISLADRDGDAVKPDGLVVEHHLVDRAQIDAAALSGGHLLHLAVAGCYFNDILRAAGARGIRITDLRVGASGGFEGDPLLSTGISYSIEIAGEATDAELSELVRDVEAAAAIPLTLRDGVSVEADEISVRGT
jgi:putative redox protein